MKTYTLSFAGAIEHKPQHPERTARKQAGSGLNFDVTFKVWPARGAMATTIRMQQRRERRATDWHPVQPLATTEGYS